MKDRKEPLVEFAEQTLKPSVVKAKQLLEFITEQASDPKTILDGFDDYGYTPSFSDIKEWTDREAEKISDQMGIELEDFDTDDFFDKIKPFLISYNDGSISEQKLIDEVAKKFSWMDKSPFWGGTPLVRHWHAAKAQSALLEIYKKTPALIDELFDLANGVLFARTEHMLAEFNPNIEPQTADELDAEMDVYFAKAKAALALNRELVELSMKIGFLYRDAWWLENHGDAARQGYLARTKAVKAGEGGSKSSSRARRNRIKLFLTVHAELIRDNPVLQNDPEVDVAYRAIKETARAHPDVFKTIPSRKTAVEYWEYIKSDTTLWDKYRKKLLSNKFLHE